MQIHVSALKTKYKKIWGERLARPFDRHEGEEKSLGQKCA